VSFGKVVWALLSVGLAYGANEQFRPSFVREYDATQQSVVTGKLTLQLGAKTSEMPLVNMHIVTADVQHVGKHYAVRELTMTSPTGAARPLRIHVSLPEDDGVDYSLGFRDPRRLRELPLRVLPSGRLGTSASYLVQDGDREDSIVGGKLVLSRIEPYGDDPVHLGYSAHGRLDLEVETPSGLKILAATVEGRVIWDEQ
jgi:hypothetical protein